MSLPPAPVLLQYAPAHRGSMCCPVGGNAGGNSAHLSNDGCGGLGRSPRASASSGATLGAGSQLHSPPHVCAGHAGLSLPRAHDSGPWDSGPDAADFELPGNGVCPWLPLVAGGKAAGMQNAACVHLAIHGSIATALPLADVCAPVAPCIALVARCLPALPCIAESTSRLVPLTGSAPCRQLWMSGVPSLRRLLSFGMWQPVKLAARRASSARGCWSRCLTQLQH
jgi:hypothetical protein